MRIAVGLNVIAPQRLGPGTLVAGPFSLTANVDTCRRVSWPNEPVGFPLIDDYGFTEPIPAVVNQRLGASRWHINNNAKAYGTRISDPGAPSLPYSFQVLYPAGFVGGAAPASIYGFFPAIRALYIGLWWKPSSPWQGGPAATSKIVFICTGKTTHCHILKLLGGGPPYRTAITLEGPSPPAGFSRNLDENVRSSSPLALGVWHQLEVYQDYNGGILKWWVDRVLVGSYTGIGYPDAGFTELNVSPTWGGVGRTVTRNQYFWFNHLRLSGR